MSCVYYQLTMKPQSPLRIGDGNTEVTDNDVLLDGRNYPFIPGSSLAGIIRSMFEEADKEKLFGFVKIDGTSENSKIIVSDAVLDSDTTQNDFTVSVRDGVGIDKCGMAIPNAKYDFQIIETQKDFTSVIECDFDSEEDKATVEGVLEKIVQNGICVGAKTTRGFGEMKAEIRKKEFLLNSQDIEEWLNFNPFDKKSFVDTQQLICHVADNVSVKNNICIHFEIKGSLLVRVKEASEKPLEDGTNPDIVTLKNANGKPVISGTSWAGAFRHHMHDICNEAGDKCQDIDLLFGKNDAGDHIKSVLCFKETEISGGGSMTVMRNAIDRFTGAPANTALYTTQIWNGGEGKLVISYEPGKLSKRQKQILAASIIDMNLGIMSIGGEASVGRGIVSIKSLMINGVESIDKLKNCEIDMLEEG